MRTLDATLAALYLVMFCLMLWTQNGELAATYFALSLAQFRLWSEAR